MVPEVMIHPAAALDAGADVAVLLLLDGQEMADLVRVVLGLELFIGQVHHLEENEVDHQHQDKQGEKQEQGHGVVEKFVLNEGQSRRQQKKEKQGQSCQIGTFLGRQPRLHRAVVSRQHKPEQGQQQSGQDGQNDQFPPVIGQSIIEHRRDEQGADGIVDGGDDQPTGEGEGKDEQLLLPDPRYQIQIPAQAGEDAQEKDYVDRLKQRVIRGKQEPQVAAAARKEGGKPKEQPQRQEDGALFGEAKLLAVGIERQNGKGDHLQQETRGQAQKDQCAPLLVRSNKNRWYWAFSSARLFRDREISVPSFKISLLDRKDPINSMFTTKLRWGRRNRLPSNCSKRVFSAV